MYVRLLMLLLARCFLSPNYWPTNERATNQQPKKKQFGASTCIPPAFRESAYAFELCFKLPMQRGATGQTAQHCPKSLLQSLVAVLDRESPMKGFLIALLVVLGELQVEFNLPISLAMVTIYFRIFRFMFSE